MKKSEFVALVAEKTGLSKKDTEKTIDAVFTAMGDVLQGARCAHGPQPAHRRGDPDRCGDHPGIQAQQDAEG